jgi:CNT family concentrative nucleoside transporter
MFTPLKCTSILAVSRFSYRPSGFRTLFPSPTKPLSLPRNRARGVSLGIENAQSLIGLGLVMAICWLLSENRRAFPWKLAIGALVVQVGLVLLLFGVPPARAALQSVGAAVDGLSQSTQTGTAFVFGYLSGTDQPFPTGPMGAPFIFAFRVMPVILVVCALSALLWHLKVLQWITRAFGFAFQKTLGLRGPPALAIGATIFMGQVEGPIFIRAYLDKLSRSELFMLMSVGMSCVSGSTMVAYATILKATLPNAAAHVLTASLISAPAGVLLARIMVPPSVVEEGGDAPFGDDNKYDSAIDAVSHGIGDGLQVVLNVGATLIVFVAFVAIADKLLGIIPPIGGQPVTIERGLGILFAPLAWAIGVPWNEAGTAGGLLGVKLVLTEFTAFIKLGAIPPGALSERTRTIMTYALCGFANIGSVGINVSGFAVLAPDRRAEILSLVWRALIVGFLATCMTASVVGVMPQALFHGV